MKKLFSAFILGVSTLTFAFWKMGKPYYYFVDYQTEIESTNLNKANKNIRIDLFMYEENTGYIISNASYNDENFNECNKFFECKIDPLASFNTLLSFSFIDEQPGLKLNNLCRHRDYKKSVCTNTIHLNLLMQNSNVLINFSKHINLVKNANDLYNNKLTHLSEEFKTSEDILINNKGNRVEISKNNRIIDFQESLIRYMNEIIILQSIMKDIKYYTNDYIQNRKKSCAAKEIQKAKNDIYITKQKLDLLQSSTILAVYAIFKSPYNQQYSIVWGLAENKKTTEKFHWITDLENDISALLSI